ncbi:MAG: hypothetical protein K940chlam7_00135 [Chlamydiae bacterium]|nr:hypothetical protein [Chlamydiota bacterium]
MFPQNRRINDPFYDNPIYLCSENCFDNTECKQAGNEAIRKIYLQHVMQREHLSGFESRISNRIEKLEKKISGEKKLLAHGKPGEVTHINTADYFATVEANITWWKMKREGMQYIDTELLSDLINSAKTVASSLLELNQISVNDSVWTVDDKRSATLKSSQIFAFKTFTTFYKTFKTSIEEKPQLKVVKMIPEIKRELDSYYDLFQSCLIGILYLECNP